MDEFGSFINRLNQSAIVLHFLDGSATLHEIFGPKAVIKYMEVQELIADVRYMPNTKVDYYGLADDQHLEGLRVKGFIQTSYGMKRPFDVLITYNSDDNKMIDEKLRDRTQAIEKLAVYARKKMKRV